MVSGLCRVGATIYVKRLNVTGPSEFLSYAQAATLTPNRAPCIPDRPDRIIKTNMNVTNSNNSKGGFFSNRSNIVLLIFLGIAGYYLLTEHRAHFFGALPWLILLACPFLHMFMHGGHGGHGHDSEDHHKHSADG